MKRTNMWNINSISSNNLLTSRLDKHCSYLRPRQPTSFALHTIWDRSYRQPTKNRFSRMDLTNCTLDYAILLQKLSYYRFLSNLDPFLFRCTTGFYFRIAVIYSTYLNKCLSTFACLLLST